MENVVLIPSPSGGRSRRGRRDELGQRGVALEDVGQVGAEQVALEDDARALQREVEVVVGVDVVVVVDRAGNAVRSSGDRCPSRRIGTGAAPAGWRRRSASRSPRRIIVCPGSAACAGAARTSRAPRTRTPFRIMTSPPSTSPQGLPAAHRPRRPHGRRISSGLTSSSPVTYHRSPPCERGSALAGATGGPLLEQQVCGSARASPSTFTSSSSSLIRTERTEDQVDHSRALASSFSSSPRRRTRFSPSRRRRSVLASFTSWSMPGSRPSRARARGSRGGRRCAPRRW